MQDGVMAAADLVSNLPGFENGQGLLKVHTRWGLEQVAMYASRAASKQCDLCVAPVSQT